MRRGVFLALLTCLLTAGTVMSTSFIMPTDDEMVTKSDAIIIGTVEGSFVRPGVDGIETVYEIRIDRALKGKLVPEALVRVCSPGGEYGDKEVLVPGAAHFSQGEKVVVFLTAHKGRWTVTDLMLGKFREFTSSTGARLLVRDSDEVDVSGRVNVPAEDRLRTSDGFINFIENAVAGRPRLQDYFVSGPSVSLSKSSQALTPLSNSVYAPETYTQMGAGTLGIRWDPSVIGSTGEGFFRRINCLGTNGGVRTCDIGGAPDTLINNALAAWTNDCPSKVVLNNAGTTTKAARMGDPMTCASVCDGVNVIEFNDPNNLISGSWTGSGTIAVTYVIFNSASTPNVGANFREIADADITFQDGYMATEPTIQTALTHEVGHAIGWRHSNAKPASPNGATTDPTTNCSSATEDCDPSPGTAIMYWAVNAAHGSTLQAWDQRAVGAVYPGWSCLHKDDFNGDGMADLVWRNTVTGQQAVWFMNGLSPVNTVFISGAGSPWEIGAVGDLNNDGWPDLIFRNYSTGQTAVWFMSGTSIISTAYLPSVSTDWKLAGSADFNGDGYDDLVFRNTVTGDNALWYMNGATVTNSVFLNGVSTQWTLCGAADMDGDGKPDLIWRNYTTGQNAIWYMQNNVLSSTAYFSSVPTNWRLEAMGDFDGNGTTDLLFRDDSTGQNAMWFMNNATVTNTAFMVGVGTDWQLMGGR